MDYTQGHYCASCNRYWARFVCFERPFGCTSEDETCPSCEGWGKGKWAYTDNYYAAYPPATSFKKVRVDGAWD